MKKFSFRKKGLIKSSINNHQSKSLPFEGRLGRVLFLLVVAIMTCGQVWGEYVQYSDVTLTNQSIEANSSYTYKVVVKITGYRFGSNTYEIASIPNANGVSKISFDYQFTGTNGVDFKIQYSEDGGSTYVDTDWGTLSDNNKGKSFSKDFESTQTLLFNSGKTIKLRIYITDGGPDSDPRYSSGKKLTFSNFKVYYSQFALSYDGNGGSSPSGKTVIFNKTYGDLATSSRTGYALDGWFTETSGGTQVTSGTTVTTAADHTIHAHWTANKYTVNFDANGGSVSPASKSVTYASTYGDLPTPTWANHRFDGWFTAASGGTQITSSTTVSITAAQTLYAHWTNIYSGNFYSYSKEEGQTWITVNGTEFSGNFSKKDDSSSKSYTQNTTPASPAYPVVCYAKANTGYTFAGWYDNESCTGTPISTSTDNWCKLTENVEATALAVTKSYYAKFTPGVTYYATAYSEARPKVAGIGLHYISCQGNNPTSDDKYTASDKQDNSNNKITTQTSSGTIRGDFYAKALIGYKFMGWYSDAACTQLAGAGDPNDRNHYVENIESTITTSPGKVITRYAKFDPISYKVRFMANTGSGTMSDQTLNYNEQKALTTNQFTKTGWDFVGWATTEGGAVVYTNGQEVKNLSSTQDSVVILYAKWTIHTWTLTWAGIDGATLSGNYTPAGATNYGTALTAPTVRKYGWKFTGWNPSVPATMPDANSTYTAQWAGVTVSAASNSPVVNFTNRTETQTATITFPVTNATEPADFKTPSVSGDGWTYKSFSYASNVVSVVIEFIATENVTTRGNHVSTVTVEGKNGNKNTGTVTASVHMTPSYSSTIAASYKVDDAAIDLNTLWTSSSNGSKEYKITKFTPSSEVNPGLTSAPEITGTMLSLGQAGTVELLLTQGVGTSSEASSDTRSLVINKHTPEFSWNSQTYNFNSSYADIFSSTNPNTQLTFTTSNSSVAEMVAGTASNKGTLKTYNGTGSANITVEQAENYKWAPKSQTFNGISIVTANNHVQFTFNEAFLNSIPSDKKSEAYWNGWIELAENKPAQQTTGWIIIPFNGIPDKLTFQFALKSKILSTSTAATANIYESSDGSNWSNAIWSISTRSSDWTDQGPIQLQPTTRYLKLYYYGYNRGQFNNLTVTELQYYRRQGDASTLNFGENQQGSASAVQSFVVEHCNAGYQTEVIAPAQYEVSLDNNTFASSAVYSTNANHKTGGDTLGTFTVYVKYLTTEVGTHNNRNVIVRNNLRGDINVPVTGTTVTKHQPEFTNNVAATYLVDDNAIDLNTLWTSTSDATRQYVIASWTPNTSHSEGSTEPSISGTTLTLGQAGTLKLRATVAETSAYYAGKDSCIVKINKRNPTITWANGPFYFNNTYNNIYTRDEGEASLFSISSSDTQVAEVEGTTMKTYNKPATTTITVSTVENYKWMSKQFEKAITPVKASNHVTFDYTKELFNNKDVTTYSSAEWPDGKAYVRIGGQEDYSQKEGYVVFKLEGVPDKLLFNYSTSTTIYEISDAPQWKIYQSTNGTTWGDPIWTSSKKSNEWEQKDINYNISQQLLPTTQYIQLYYYGFCAGDYRVTVTELEYFRRQGDATTLNFGSNQKGIVPAVQSFTVEHCNAGYQTGIKAPAHYQISLDATTGFTDSITYSTNATALTGGDKKGSFTVYVKYLSDELDKTHPGNVVVSNNLRSSVLIPVTGTTVGMLSTTLHYIGATTSMMVDTGNVASNQMFEVRDANNQLVSSANITLATSDGSIISLVDDNTINPVCGGTATITASYAGDGTTYKAAESLQQQITVNKLNDEVNFVAGKSVILNGDSYEANWATAVSGSTITYSSDNESIIKVEDGRIKAVGKGTANVIASSAGNCQYIPNNASFPVKVRNAEDPCETKLLEDYNKYSVGAFYGPHDVYIADGPADKLTFKIWRYTAATEEATLTLYDKNNEEIGSFVYSASSLPTSEPSSLTTIDLSQYTTKKPYKIHLAGTGALNKYFKSLIVTQQVYLTPSSSAVTMSSVKACDTASAEFTLSYSDISRIQMSHKNNDFWYEIWKGDSKIDDFDNDCGDWGTYTLKCFYAPQQVGDYKDTITVSASGIAKTIIVSGTALKPDREIVWDLAPGNEIFVTQSVTLDARAKTKCLDPAGEVEYSADPADAATIDGNKVTFTKAGTVTVYANTVASDLYGDAQSVYKVWSVKKVISVVTKAPEITSTITYGDAGSSVTWSDDWTAVDSLNRKPLEGAMSYASPATFTSAGKQNVVLNFTPTDLTNYDATAVNVPVTVQKATPTITWPIASNVVYTPTLTLADVTLQNGYATFKGAVVEGTFAWKVPTTTLEAGDGQSYAVVFTPTSDNFNGDEDNVSFNVTKATPDALPEAITLTYGEKANEKTITSTSTSTVAGTWTWNDSRVSDVLNVGNYDMNVRFVPTDTKNYTEKDATLALTVAQATPVVTVTASDITYGQKLSESQFSNSSMEGTWTWIDEHKEDVKDVGSYDVQAHFVPTNGNYKAIDQNVSVTVNKATPTVTTWPTASQITEGQALSQSSLSGGKASVAGSFAWKVPETTPAVGETAYLVVFTPTDGDNYNSVEGNVMVKVVALTNTFINTKGDGNWNDAANWSSGVVPAKDQEVDINVKGELNIAETITVGSLTIENTGKVNVIQSGKLSVKKESGESSGYGDLYVKNGGDIALKATLDVRNFYIESSIGSGEGTNKSGQITNADNLAFHEGDAYIDINLDPSGTADDSQWYGFAVPFQVDIATGVYRQEKDGSFKQLKDKTNFDIMRYNPTKRLNSSKGWEYYHGVLNAGEIYYIAIDGTNNVYRFRKKAETPLVASNEITLKTNGDVSNPNANWNPVGNPCLRYTSTQYGGYVQVYKNGESAYLTIPAKAVTYVVGCPFFIQAKKDSTIVMETSDATTGQFYAPRRTTMEDKSTYQVQLLQVNGKLEDQIFVSASETASNTYETEADLLKAGTSTKCGQIWVNAYSQILSVNEGVLENNSATYSLSLYAPKAGEYTLHVGNNTANGTLYLTKNGNIIWDLSKDDYPVSLTAGTNSEYGLVFQKTIPNIPTGIDNTKAASEQIEKFIYQEQMYILKNGRLYNSAGAKVK